MNFPKNIQSILEPSLKIARANLLRKLLFGYVIFNFFEMLPLLDALYNPSRFIATQSMRGITLNTLLNLLSANEFKDYYLLFMAVQIIAALVGLIGFLPQLTTCVVFFTTVNLQNRIYPTLTGGDALLCLLLFYLIFISNGKQSKNKYLQEIKNASDNTFILICQLQVIIVYVVSAIYKWQSAEWLQGSAIQKVLLIDEYSFPFLQNAVCAFPFVFKIFTWAALLYLTLFPFLIFLKRIKNYVILTGIIFHVFIAIAMGLFNFSLVMICCYALFYNFKTKDKLRLQKQSS